MEKIAPGTKLQDRECGTLYIGARVLLTLCLRAVLGTTQAPIEFHAYRVRGSPIL